MSIQNLLIIDDSPVSRKMLRSCLPREQAFTIAEAGDGAAGLEQFRAQRPDLTFLDLTMPRMAGLECLAQLKALAPDAVVIVVTGDVQARSISQALDLGAAEVVRKPPTRDKIAAALARAEALVRGSHAG